MYKLTILSLFVMIAIIAAYPSEFMPKDHLRYRRGLDLPNHEKEVKDVESENPSKEDLSTDSSYWYRHRFYSHNNYNFGGYRNYGYYPYAYGYSSPFYGNNGFGYPYNYYY